jgi:hypothetical protein
VERRQRIPASMKSSISPFNTAAVLNGEIDDFIEAGIRWRRSTHA